MDKEYGYFSISRKLTESPLWLSEKFTKAQAWVDLFGLARYEDTESFFYVRGIKIVVKMGQLAWPENELAKRWRWSRNKVRAFLATLEKSGNIEQQKSNVITLVSIVNYCKYQNKGQQTEQQKDNRKTTESTHNNKGNKVNKENKNTLPQNPVAGISEHKDFPLFKETVEKFHAFMVKTNPDLMRNVLLNVEKSAKTLEELIRLDGYSLKEIQNALNFGVTDKDFWSTQILSIANLRVKGKNGFSKFQNLFAKYQASLNGNGKHINGSAPKQEVYVAPPKKEWI
jgi:hypothetical protein